VALAFDHEVVGGVGEAIGGALRADGIGEGGPRPCLERGVREQPVQERPDRAAFVAWLPKSLPGRRPYCFTNSTRLFCARPRAVSLAATGRVAP
jgi:hypothetical protein